MMTKQAELKQIAYQSSLKSRALSILIYLIDRSNKDLTCFPAIPTIAEQLHVSVSTVKRALHELVDAGFIKKDARYREKNRGQTSNLYTIVRPDNDSTIPTQDKDVSTIPATEHREVIENSQKVQNITFADIFTCNPEQASSSTEHLQNISDKVVENDNTKSFIKKKSLIQFFINNDKDYLLAYIKCIGKTELSQFCFSLNQLWTGVEVNLRPP